MNNRLLDSLEVLYHRIPKKLIEGLFYFAFTLVLVYDYCFLTRFERGPFRILYICGALLAGVVVIFRVFNLKREKTIWSVLSLVCIFVGFGYLIARHSFYFFVLAVLTCGAVHIDAKKIFELYFVIAFVFFLIMVVRFLDTTGGWKYDFYVHFGSINSTDCQGMLFFILVSFLFFRGTQITYTEILLFSEIVIVFWTYTQAELNVYCSIACLIIATFFKLFNSFKLTIGKRTMQVTGYILSSLFVVIATIMILFTAKYDPNNEEWAHLNDLLHRRLEYAHNLYLRFPPKLWGSEYIQVGLGYDPSIILESAIEEVGYSFIDSSYPNILINHGFLVFVVLIGTMTLVSIRYSKEGCIYEVLLLMVLAIEFAGESHLKDLSCNVWLILPFASINTCKYEQIAYGVNTR